MKIPSDVTPMLATTGDLPHNSKDYAFEYKWDGVRAIVSIDHGAIRIHSRNQIDVTFKYPELRPLAAALKSSRVILDGEIVSLDAKGRPSFSRLQQRMQLSSAAAVELVIDQYPVNLVLFDVLWIDGKWTTAQSFTARRAMLEELVDNGPTWQLSPSHVGDGEAMLETARLHGLEGVVAKRLNSEYIPGVRSSAWIKIKVVHRQEFVIGGWVPEGRANHARVGAMLMGYYDDDKKLRYVGKVGSGLNAGWHGSLVRRFSRVGQASNPFSDPVPSGGVRFLKPRLVAEVEFRRWPEGSLLQQAVFKGLRDDKPAKDVVKEFRD